MCCPPVLCCLTGLSLAQAVEGEKARLVGLLEHFPELPLLYPHADLLGFQEMQGLLRRVASHGKYGNL